MCSLTCHQRVLSHIWRSSTPQSFIKISANNSCLKELPLIEDIKMPLNTLRKETSKYLYQVKVSGRSTRLASSLFIPTAWTRAAYLSILIATTCAWKTKISSYYLKLTNKNILLHLPATKTNFKTEQFSQNYAFSTRRQYYSVNNATYIENWQIDILWWTGHWWTSDFGHKVYRIRHTCLSTNRWSQGSQELEDIQLNFKVLQLLSGAGQTTGQKDGTVPWLECYNKGCGIFLIFVSTCQLL